MEREDELRIAQEQDELFTKLAAADELARAGAKILEWYDGVHTGREVLHEGAGMMKRALEKWEKASKK